MKQIKMHDKTNEQLTEISKKRKLEHAQIRTKQGIVEKLVSDLYSKEC